MKNLFFAHILLVPLLLGEEDTTRVFRMGEVVVTGIRMPALVEQLPSSVRVVDSAMMAQGNGVSAADFLRHSAGVFVNSYGGNGALQSISIHGMGSDYSLVLVDGQRYTLYQQSTVDLGIFSLMDVDRIEIASGGNSSSYGADAVGGVVNIITRRPGADLEASVSGSVGSFGMSGFHVSVGEGNERFSIRGSMRRENSRNDFSFYFDDGITRKKLKRDGADYSLNNYSLSSNARIDQNITAKISVRYSNSERGQPSAVTSADQNNLARIHDKDIFCVAAIDARVSPLVSLSLPFSVRYNNETYNDPKLLIGNSSVPSFYRNSSGNFTPTATLMLSQRHIVLGGIDVARAAIVSNEVKASTRTQLSGFLSSEHRFDLPLELIVYPSLRYDSFSDATGDISPKLGINIGIVREPMIRLRSSYGKNYRVPTFNDLYWIQGGNPNLQPEHSLNFDAGIVFGADVPGKIEMEANYFSIQTRDKIVWQPVANGVWSPKNLQSVSATGIDFSASVRLWDDVLSIRYAGNYVQAIKTSAEFPSDATRNKYLVYLPQKSSMLTVGASLYKISLALNYAFTGYRFTTQDNDPRFVLPAFDRFDANISGRLSAKGLCCIVRGEVNNLFNADYRIIPGYPVPLRNVTLKTEFTIQ